MRAPARVQKVEEAGNGCAKSPLLKKIADAVGLPSTSGRGVGGEGKTLSSNGIGVFWQTQGSGKSFAMVFYAQKILRKIPGNWTFSTAGTLSPFLPTDG